jgi:hypothetical protein
MSTRRDFITLLGGAAAWPLAARAQQAAMPVVGFMTGGSPGPLRRQIAAVHEGLKEAGYVDGQNVMLEWRFAEGQLDRFPAFAAVGGGSAAGPSHSRTSRSPLDMSVHGGEAVIPASRSK